MKICAISVHYATVGETGNAVVCLAMVPGLLPALQICTTMPLPIRWPFAAMSRLAVTLNVYAIMFDGLFPAKLGMRKETRLPIKVFPKKFLRVSLNETPAR